MEVKAFITTVELAKALGVSRTTVSQWITRKTYEFAGPGPVQNAPGKPGSRYQIPLVWARKLFRARGVAIPKKWQKNRQRRSSARVKGKLADSGTVSRFPGAAAQDPAIQPTDSALVKLPNLPQRVRCVVSIEEDLVRGLDNAAVQSGYSAGEILEEALRVFLDDLRGK